MPTTLVRSFRRGSLDAGSGALASEDTLGTATEPQQLRGSHRADSTEGPGQRGYGRRLGVFLFQADGAKAAASPDDPNLDGSPSFPSTTEPYQLGPPASIPPNNGAFLNSFFIFFSVFACALTLLLCVRLILKKHRGDVEDEEDVEGRNERRNQRPRRVEAKTGLDPSFLVLLPRRLVTAETKFLAADVMPQEQCESVLLAPDVKDPGHLESAEAIPKECAVCLSDYEEGDVVRWLPSCGHTFHGVCIDEWLDSKTTCPICRVDLEPLLRDSCKPLECEGEESPSGPADCNANRVQQAAAA